MTMTHEQYIYEYRESAAAIFEAEQSMEQLLAEVIELAKRCA